MQNDNVDAVGQAGMVELLRVAADESQTEPWPRVHAINTLRLTFNDKNLANDVSGFFAQGNMHENPPGSFQCTLTRCKIFCQP